VSSIQFVISDCAASFDCVFVVFVCMLSIKLTIFSLVLRRSAKLLRENTESFILRVSAQQRLVARSFLMFSYFFCKSESFEHPISDREFEWLLVVESPPVCPHQSLAYDDEPVSSAPMNPMQLMFDKKKFYQNLLWFKFHNEVCCKLG